MDEILRKRLQNETFFRDFNLERKSVDEKSRTVKLAFSSEEPVDRFFGTEILDHDSKSVRLDRIRSGGALLLGHNPDDQVGVVEDAAINPADRVGRATVRFSKSAKGEEVFQDVIDGIRKSISVGYRIHEMVQEKKKDGSPTYRAIDWEPLEISLVSIPADASVGVGRSIDEQQGRIILMENVKVLEEKTRIMTLQGMGQSFDCVQKAREAIDSNWSTEDFRKWVQKHIHYAKPIPPGPPDLEWGANLGMGKKEIKEYSLVRAIRTMSENRPLDGLEKEASDATAKLTGRQAKGFFIPEDITASKRVMQAGDSAKGGFTVGSDVLGESMIELLRNRTVVSQLGALNLGGLVGNVLIPRITGGAVAAWLSETGTSTATDQAFGQLSLVPKRLAATTAYSKELLIQASIDVEGFIRGDLMRVLAIAKDLAALDGLGANGQPLGIINTTGIKSVTFGAAATFAKLIDFETQVANANADVGSLGYLTTTAVRGKWKSAVKVTNQAVFLWENGPVLGSSVVNGYRAEATNQMPGNKVIFGNWNDLIMADWSGMDVVVDPYSLKKQGQIEITITLYTDIGVRNAVSFAVSTDSGAQ